MNKAISINKRSQFSWVAMLIMLLILCGTISCTNEYAENDPDSGAISFDIVWPEGIGDQQLSIVSAVDCNALGISTIACNVYNGTETSANFIKGETWQCTAHSGTVMSVTGGSNRRVVVTAKDSSGESIYKGEKTGITVTAGQTVKAGTVSMVSLIDDDPNDVDDDGDGYTENEGDCNDSNSNINPGEPEICGDGIDQDCDGNDKACAPAPDDVDNDGDGYTENEGDCNDNNFNINPGEPEICSDGIDQDCSGNDETCLPDQDDVDNDGDGYTENDGDCNDSNADINPGESEICGDRIDQDCSGSDQVCPISKYVSNGNGTVTDTKTGLIWQRATAPGKYNWYDATSYCESLTLAGYSDWRLPSKEELESLVDTNYLPTIEINYFPDTKLSYYWSSSTYAYDTDLAWDVDFQWGEGYVGYDFKSEAQDCVRAVRGGQ